ncbi:hypothetical protein Q9R29_08525 [Rothia sp. ARF10]|nr:hypothetical protein [Rothia sp. ARF10]
MTTKYDDIPIPEGDYMTLDGLKVWWHKGQPDRIHLATNRSDIAEEDGSKEGLRIVFSSNPESADYNPGNFNRMARFLKKHGKSHPETVEKKSRRLRDR